MKKQTRQELFKLTLYVLSDGIRKCGDKARRMEGKGYLRDINNFLKTFSKTTPKILRNLKSALKSVCLCFAFASS